MGQRDAFIVSRKDDAVVARYRPAAQARKADRAGLARASLPITPAFAIRAKRNHSPKRCCFAQQQRRAGRSIHFVPVVHLDNLDIPIWPQLCRRFADQAREQGDAQRGIPGLQHRDMAGGIINRAVQILIQPSRADQDGRARRNRGADIGQQRLGRREIDEHVAGARERNRVAARVNRATQRQILHARDGVEHRLPHPPFASDHADACHGLLSFRYMCFMVEMTDIRNIVILTGAGISAESGIGTFRDAGGLWEQHRIEDVATPEGFARDPDLVFRFYDMRRDHIQKAEPNPAHEALARLDRDWPGELLIVTQNVDDLHERAGAKRLIHMHGEHLSAWCTACDVRTPWRATLGDRPPCPACGTNALRPDVVWFGEMPYRMNEIDAAIMRCDLFVSVGTSGAVYPAAGYVRTASHYGARTLELNLEPSQGSFLFDETRLGRASDLVPTWVDEVLA